MTRICSCWSYGGSVNNDTRKRVGSGTSNGPPMFASSVETAFNLLSKLLAKFAYTLRNESLILCAFNREPFTRSLTYSRIWAFIAFEVFASELNREAQALSRSWRCSSSKKDENGPSEWCILQVRDPGVVNTLSDHMFAV